MHDIAHAAANAARPPRYDDVLCRGRQRRRRRHALVAGGAALAVVTILGAAQVLGTGGGGALQPAPSPPTTSSTAALDHSPTPVPYWEGGALHVGGESIATGFRDIRYSLGTTVVGDADFERGSEWYLVAGGRLVPIVASEELVRLVVSPDGEVLAWVESTSETTRTLVVWDVATRAVLDSVEIPVDVQCCDAVGELFIAGVDLDHRVVYSTRGSWVWAPGSDPVPLSGVAQPWLGSDPWPGGLMFQGTGGSPSYKAPPGVYGTVDDDGRFQRVGTTPVDQGGLWSPDGRTYAFGDEFTDGIRAQRDGRVSELSLPTGGGWGLVAWESDRSVLLERRGQSLARCDVTTLACTTLDQRPTMRTVWPEHRAG